MNVGQAELASLSRMFSAAVLRELGRHGQSQLLARLLHQSSIPERVGARATIGDAFERAFATLRSLGNRDEYVYRSAITQKILLGQHSLRTASMVGEARVGMCKADVVVFNGTSTAYEIKSERDSLSRLHNQVTSYGRVFAAVNVVTSPKHLPQVLERVPGDVGVLVLSERFTLRTERAAVADPGRTDPLAVLDFVRANEAAAILHACGIDAPRVPNTQLRSRLRDIFATLDAAQVHQGMVSVLRKTRSQSALADSLPSIPMSLRAAMLTLKMDNASRTRVHDATLLPVGAALAWS
ncbi:sce7726 family protein [Microbacterium sp. NPDC087589]|uniref:sce7726 family protein n=1 Tax=Microbacterium sp. NPDC087589 TaxID=3364191 RepID=UPI0038275C99